MDPAVLAAQQRWPNVPAVFGWLSLSARGQWRLHPQGDATPGQPGEGITNPQLLAFIGRNYLADANGRWFFQNGPQRVYVLLALAPWIVRLADDARGLVTHTGLPITQVHGWWLAPSGTLYLQTPLGPGAILDRDLASVLGALGNAAGQPLEAPLLQDPDAPLAEALAGWAGTPLHWRPGLLNPAPLNLLPPDSAASVLGFVQHPCPPLQQRR